jgi:hypothetical protein
MNPKIVDRMYDETSASFGRKVRMSKRQFKRPEFITNLGKNMALFAIAASVVNEKKKRNTNSRKLSNFERRKQHKVRYDTWRRPEIPTEEDIRLENIHYANFLGDKYGDNNAPYNSQYPVNVRFCDSMAEHEEPKELDSLARRANELDRMTDSTGSYVNPYAYIQEYAEDDDQSVISELSLGSNSDSWSLDGGDREFCLAEDEFQDEAAAMNSDAISERIASAFKEMHEQTMLYQYWDEQIASAIELFNEYGYSNKRNIEEAYEERVPEPAFKRARCDDESNNV